ncbi:GMC oxidoreductase-domain-containing protein [Stachybotrys elegans]|uniref:GMC oxidoreductase-domain-containing protein n=1 Tax=Stachybotrys elegans TaxID=80388 RepID=A0A8K0SPU3_9HYPO|nr:GMC oxidoreductase-domain-containing protein [Stachybotrys elegans]
MHTPQVLERSGIGARDVLEAAGVDVKVELPGVGWNFQSHNSFSVNYTFGADVFPTLPDLLTNPALQQEAMQLWVANKTGPFAGYVNSGIYIPFTTFSSEGENLVAKLEDQTPEQYLPEGIDPTLVAGYAVQKEILTQRLLSNKSAWLESPLFPLNPFSVFLLHGFSRGSVHISPDDNGINTEPLIDYRALSNPIDMDLTVELLKGVRWYMGHEAMVEAIQPTEIAPLVTDDEEIREHFLANLDFSVPHQFGTAALGPRSLGGVVGADLRVHGVGRLSVADNSVVPMVPGAHPLATAYAIGEKAADLILRRT